MKKYSYKKSKVNRELEKTFKEIKKFEWKHRNIILLIVSFVIAYYILKTGYIHVFISKLGDLGYIGSFIGGALFPYGLTAAPAAATLYVLGETLNPFLLALIAAFGAVLSDYLIFRFVRDKLMDEIKLLSEEINQLTKPVSSLVFPEEIRVILWRSIARSRIWKTLIPIIAGFVIASPLPDEFGAALFGAVKFEPKKFIIYAYCLHFVGILALTSLAKIL